MMLTFRNLLITHVHIEASMGGARAKVTEVMRNGSALRIGSLQNRKPAKRIGAAGEQECRAGKMKPVRELPTDFSSAPLRTHRPSASR